VVLMADQFITDIGTAFVYGIGFAAGMTLWLLFGIGIGWFFYKWFK